MFFIILKALVMLTYDNPPQLCGALLDISLQDHKHKRVKLGVIELIPRLSEHCSDIFVRVHLVRVVVWCFWLCYFCV